ncbi:bifunctional tetrahydrofolate synthase/dihydrofolate synthase [Sodalis endosymbiont of Henestaris halophilus]|uniref:bifunctional tetrahydrofolate synthase/dihydrofolate synthase n=1 Tax=Sodalis endosymbiont of Henestaris halophilus TaxID=1929246 RepID=UPI000BC0928D|nr:bifunctional tetrahydrofolate synthase/dihydrofolate synthase [Sodalis endosymbiont of Henestaris halophilus]SNC58853.1 Bifunctional protein FolC [Sodalis endosymbiont of Henestaris halophilus]
MYKNLLIPKATSPLVEWMYYLEHLNTNPINLGLEQIRRVANSLNLLRPAPYIIIVGGTNGKGTTCRLLETILLVSGIRVGVYSSPHFLRYTERVRIQGEELPEKDHSEAMAVIEANRGKTSLSYFEFSTLAALKLFRQAELDVVILEVGLGGRLDATNIVDADVSVITSIAIDHTDYLGPDRASIAREKAGIFRFGMPAIVGEPDRSATLEEAADNMGADLYACNRNWWWQNEGQHWHWWDNLHELTALPLPAIPLDNAGTALAVISRLPFAIPNASVIHGLRFAELPGRFQCISQAPITILDVAHNPHAASYLARRMGTIPNISKVRAVVGMLVDKDIAGTLACLREQVDVWYCASLYGPRAASSAQLAEHLDSDDVHQFQDVLSAWNQAIVDAKPEDCVLVFGSFQTVAPIMAIANKEKYYGN